MGRTATGPYGDSMILAERIFSQSAPAGVVSIAYFRKLAPFCRGGGVQTFAKGRSVTANTAHKHSYDRNPYDTQVFAH